MKQPVFERQRLAQRRTFGAKPATAGRMVRIARDLGAAVSIRRGDDAATDAAVRTGGADRSHRSCSPGPRASRSLMRMSERDARGPAASVHIALIAAGLCEAVEPGLGGCAFAALFRGDFQQRILDVLVHA